MPDLAEICDALAAEGDALDVVVAALSAEEWSTPTPSEGWTVADQIGHLATFDWNGALAIRDADAFAEHATELMGRVVETGSDSFMLEEPRSMAPESCSIGGAGRARTCLGKLPTSLTTIGCPGTDHRWGPSRSLLHA